MSSRNRTLEPVVLQLPRRFVGQAMSQVMANLVNAAPVVKPERVILDFSKLEFIDPAGICFSSNMAYWLKEKEIAVELVGTESYGYPISYLDDSLFFLEHLGNTLKSGVSPRSTTLPLKRVEHADSHQHVQFTVVPWLSSKILVSESSLATISVCVKELFNNIPDHAQKNSGCMFVQYFPKKERIVIVVSDFGLGIPKVVQTAKPELSDVDAILQAVQEGFTTSSTPRNRGAGLSFILQSVVIRYGGIVTIYSGRGVVSFWKQRGCGLVSRRWRQPTGFCPGTLFEIDLQVANLPSVFEEVGELTWD